MAWSEAYTRDTQPTDKDISDFIANPNWQALQNYLQESYGVAPMKTYSACSGQRGWNVKYQKSGKALCTLYPMEGYFIALVVMAEKHWPEAEAQLPFCSEYTQNLYMNTVVCMHTKWLMMDVRDERVLEDAKNLIAIRMRPKRKQAIN